MSDNRHLGSVNKAQAVTPSNSTDLADSASPNGKIYTRGISVTVGGDVSFLDDQGNVRTAAALAAGIIHPIRTCRIRATGTTATGITAYW